MIILLLPNMNLPPTLMKGIKMQKRIIGTTSLLLLAVALLFTAGCDLTANADWDQNVDFSAIKTYQWAGQKPNALSDLAHKRIVAAVDEQLQAKGLSQTQSGPDVYIIYYGDSDKKVMVNTDSYGYGYGPGWYWGGGGMRGSTTTVSTYQVGTLVIDMYSTAKKELIWRGTVSGTISDNPQKNAKLIQKAVEKVFKKYPPKKK